MFESWLIYPMWSKKRLKNDHQKVTAKTTTIQSERGPVLAAYDTCKEVCGSLNLSDPSSDPSSGSNDEDSSKKDRSEGG